MRAGDAEPVEDTDGRTDVVSINAPSAEGKHIRHAGEDVTAGATVLRTGQLVAYFQPEVELASGRVVAAESLARWEHPELGTLSPVLFTALATKLGLMREMHMGQRHSGVIITPHGKQVVSPADRELLEQYGAAAEVSKADLDNATLSEQSALGLAYVQVREADEAHDLFADTVK